MVRTGTRDAAVAPVPLVWYNPDLSSARFLVPGLLAFILMVTSVIATALAVVREKERGTMESLRATPLVAIELLVGKTLPYLLLASGAAAGALVIAWLLFDVHVRGSLFWLAAVTLLFLAVSLGWGILVSTVAETQQVAFQLGLLSSMLPTFILSGFIFPISSMPPALQVITHIVPARYFLVALREIILKGAGPEVWWNQAVGLLIYGAAVLALATHPHGPEPVMRTLLNILIKELLQLKRDPKILPILFMAPVIQLTLLGYAATTDIKRVELAVCDLDRTAASRQLVDRFTSSTYFRVTATVDSQEQFTPLLQSGKARVALTIPAGFEAERSAGRPARVQLVADGADAIERHDRARLRGHACFRTPRSPPARCRS